MGHVCDCPSILCPATILSWNQDVEVLVLVIGVRLDPPPHWVLGTHHWAAPVVTLLR